MNLTFTKMHALGNDFVVFDFTEEAHEISSEQAAFIADRHFGIGCDQILIVEQSTRDDIDFKYRIYNADGSEVGQCGNGARCFARFVHDNELSNNNPVRVETITGDMELALHDNGQVSVVIQSPDFEPSNIPLDAAAQQDSYTVNIDGQDIHFFAASMGNPHAVILVDDVTTAPVQELGAQLEQHPIFPERVNVGFMQVVDRSHIKLRVFERGAGETLACGSGACAAVACGQANNLLDQQVTVSLPGGDLSIEWPGEGHKLTLTGPTDSVYTGAIEIG